jgi:hypothetical protein
MSHVVLMPSLIGTCELSRVNAFGEHTRVLLDAR